MDIHLKPDLLKSLIGMGSGSGQGNLFERLPSDMQRIIAGDPDLFLSPIQAITPAIQVALQQLLNCPYQGVVKQLYLESKTLELLSLWLEQAVSGNFAPEQAPCSRNSDEIDRVYHAKEILTQQMDNPPCLMDLARQVGLNDCTLKRKFRQVFGTTVFGYLHNYRMEQARSLLLENQLSVMGIAHQVGYNNLCAFSTAFRKKFGVSPRQIRR